MEYLSTFRKNKRMSKVNLDALIPKEDFISNAAQTTGQTKLNPLTFGHLDASPTSYQSIYSLLRKPDFQRETNEWDKVRIYDLITSFANRDFVPSIILWENTSTNKIYVIDGAHRLSALIAYINDDYGDGAISINFYGKNNIPDAEIDYAIATRKYINSRIGSFLDNVFVEGSIANKIKLGTFDVQMIPGGVERAEDSFFKINQQGVVLSPTEKALCKGREYGHCIATRIIMKGGAGSQYWQNFNAGNKKKVNKIAQEIHDLIFTPQYKRESTSTVLHHPLGGDVPKGMPMIYELMKIIKDPTDTLDNSNGSETVFYLDKILKIVRKMLSKKQGSLGLFPTVYFYNGIGKYIQSSFLGMVYLLIEKEKDPNFLPKLTKARANMERFLMEHKMFLTQINRKYGSKERSYRHFKGYYENIIELFYKTSKYAGSLTAIKRKYPYFNEKELEYKRPKEGKSNPDYNKFFNINTDILEGTPQCHICSGYVYPLYKSIDHVIKRVNKGKTNLKNNKVSHLYCNMSRDKLESLGIYKPKK